MNSQLTSSIQQSAQQNSYHARYHQPSATMKSPKSGSVADNIYMGKTLTEEPLNIRLAKPADAAALAAIGGKAFTSAHQIAVSSEEMNRVVASSWSEKQLTEWITNPEIQVFVAEVEQQIVGLTALNPTYRPSYLRRSAPIELCRTYLHHDWIGCGVGSKLMTSALRQALLTGYGICWLRIWQGNKSAIQFYRRWGFTTISADYYAIGNTMLPVWVMIHPLTNKEGE